MSILKEIAKPGKNNINTLLFVITFLLLLIGSIVYTQYQSKKNILELKEANKNANAAFEINNCLQELIYHIESAEIYAREIYAAKKGEDKNSIADTLKIINNHIAILKQQSIQKQSQDELNGLLQLADRKMSFVQAFIQNVPANRQLNYDAKKIDQLLEVGLNDSLFYSALQLQQQLENDLKQTFVQSNRYSNKVLSLNTILSVIVILAIALLSTLIIKKLLHQISLISNLGREKERADNSAKVKEQFLANMSHEIRTPINAVIGFTNLLKKTNLDHNQKQFVDLIYNSGDNLLAVVNDILDISKIEAGMMRITKNPFSLRDVCTAIEMMFYHKVREKNLEFNLNYDKTIPVNMMGDEDRLNQVLINLINNAIKFTKEGGAINIDIKLLDRTSSRNKIKFVVNDTGIGIPKEKLSTIFDRFEQADAQTSREYGGTGLGLAIVKQIINLQEGEISVESTPGVGTTFTFTLIYEAIHVQDPVSNANAANENKIFSGYKILVAEDNKTNQVLIKFILQQWDLNFDLAENGNEVIGLMQKNKYDLILMDIQMPMMDGYAAAVEIRKNLQSDIPIVAMTAHVLPTEKQKCIEAGMNDYISKPINEKELHQMIGKYLQQSEKNLPVQKKGNGVQQKGVYVDLPYLENIFSVDKSFINEIMLQFKIQYPKELRQLKENILAKNKENVLGITHHMKTTVTSLSVKTPLKPVLDKIEQYATVETWTNANEALHSLLHVEETLMEEVDAVIAKNYE